MITIFTGRFDQYCAEEDFIIWFEEMLQHFDCTDSILVFEDETKTGIKCKPHYHFLIKTEALHDNIRRYISKNIDLKGAHSSLKSIDDDNFELAMIYILKQYKTQQYIPFSDYTEEELNEYIKISATYQTKIKLNSWPDHLEEITKQINLLPDHDTICREHIYNFIFKYTLLWNKDDTKERIDLPCNMKKVINYIESRVLHEITWLQRSMQDAERHIHFMN